MTGSGLAIEALLKGAKPLGDDEEQGHGAPDAESTETDAPNPSAASATPGKEAEGANLAADV
ncbi:hypothetical protein ACWGII_14405 [Streptomyces sp. NPDC054855]